MAEPNPNPTPETALIPATRPAANEIIRMGMDTVQGFEALQRCAKLLSASALVPDIYRGPNGLASCVIALNLATRIGADALLVMQNLYIVQGKPAWSSKFLIATFNQCGKYTAIRYRFEGELGTDSYGCRAWAIEKATGEKLVGPLVTIGIAKKEGWFDKSGSKWKTMPEQMLRYRSGGWFINTIAPELAMGLPAADEVEDFVTLDEEGNVVSTGKGPRIIGSGSSESGTPKALGEWAIEQLDELEELIEKIHGLMAGAGFKKEADAFEADTRAKRSKTKPEDLLPKLREEAAKMEAAAAQAPPPAAQPQSKATQAKTAPKGQPKPAPAAEVDGPADWIITDADGEVQADFKGVTRDEAMQKLLRLLGKPALPEGWHVERIES